ncbi:hypothetical protein [Streptomyces sp. NPDC023327]|uniref:hypothetical protein n=1 Tax=Streptomyces sp. NPDC023327 TaxID=3157088 RepID=UPI0033E15DCC
MRNRRALSVYAALLGSLALCLALSAAPAAGATGRAVGNPNPLPLTDTLIGEGVTIEGPLINTLAFPRLL